MKKKSGKRSEEHPKASKRFKHSGIRSGGNDGAAVELSGKIQGFRTNHHDDIDGFQFVDGTVIRFPPHIGQEIDGHIEIGDEVRVVGAHHETPHGDIQLRASFIECVRSEFEIEIDRSDKKKHKGNRFRQEDQDEPALPYQEILAEITAIRTLLQARIVPSKKERRSQQDCVLKELKELRGLLQPD